MISERLVKSLNEQMNYEFYSAQAYLAAAAYCSHGGVDGFANFFLAQAEEERYHAMKFYRFINDLGERAEIKEIPAPHNTFSSVLDTFKKSLEHEKEVTKRIYNLADIALDEREHATMTFLNWFIEEQVEEEATFDTIIQKLERIENDSNAFYMLESELGKRTFTPGN
ncbi:ferritin [Salipaludibacillus aurantiacus]|uniref:Ferritin n=1 Tax=Salipaludibacillus aurantiacus TaxID=1601833 RepID=A0A1H9VKG4_9BACI|nr:ferritin [Salipaludibacillus aurantiacus]SES22240.1 ferritin [Salipaludibacillus aurantiacus]